MAFCCCYWLILQQLFIVSVGATHHRQGLSSLNKAQGGFNSHEVACRSGVALPAAATIILSGCQQQGLSDKTVCERHIFIAYERRNEKVSRKTRTVGIM